MKTLKKIPITAVLLLVLLFLHITSSAQTQTQPQTCDPCAAVAWGAPITVEFDFTPAQLPNCILHATITYRTKMCNGMIMYEILNEEMYSVSGSCGFAVCVYSETWKDVEKYLILNVFGTTQVLSSKPSSCMYAIELDENSDPNFVDCWTHHGLNQYQSPPWLYLPCGQTCCVAEANVRYDANGRPFITWDPISGSAACDPVTNPPTTYTYTICCEPPSTTTEGCSDERTFTLNVINVGPCEPYCNSSIFYKNSVSTDVIQDNINFLRQTAVYPSPFSDSFKLNIVLPANEKVKIEVVDALGKILVSKDLNYKPGQKEYTIDAHAVAKGSYFCRVTSSSFGSVVKRIQKL